MESAGIDFTDREALEKSVSDNGAVTLSWEKPESISVELEQSDTSNFENSSIRYEGIDSASVISGLPEGVHYFRIRDANSEAWSKPITIKVEFFPRSRLTILLVSGGVVVLATIATIISGFFASRKREEPSS